MSNQERTLYANSILVSQKPIDATDIVRVRLSQAKLLNDEFSEFFKRYHAIRSQYTNELTKLLNSSKDLNRNIQHGIVENQVLSREELKYYNVDAIGHLSQIWNQVTAEIEGEIQTNLQLKHALEKDVIGPLSGYTTRNPRWSEMRDLHKNLSDIANHLHYNGEKADKSEKHRSQLAQYNAQWDSEAPFVFEVFESTDFQRLSFLRDSLLKFITAYGDTLQSLGKANEKALESILNFDPEEEIKRFAKVSSETAYIPENVRRASAYNASNAQSRHEEKHSSLFNHGKSRNASSSTTGTTKIHSNGGAPSITSEGKKTKEKNKLRSKVGSIFGRKKKNNKELSSGLPQIDDIRAEESSLYEPPTQPSRLRQDSRADSYVSSHTAQLRSEGNGTAASNRSKQTTSIPQQQQATSQFDAPSLQPLSLSQAPLQPTNRANTQSQPTQPSVYDKASTAEALRNSRSFSYDSETSNINQSAPPSQAENGYGANAPQIQPQQTQEQQPQQTQQPLPPLPPATEFQREPQHIKAPAPPPSRKPHNANNNLGNITEDSIQSSFAPSQTNYSSVPTHAPTSRKDIQSGLFHDLNTASVEQYQNKRISSVASLGNDSLRLNPQATGSSIIGINSSLLQHNSTGLVGEGLNASIAEVVNAKFKDGELVTSSITGEIAFNYNSTTEQASLPTGTNLQITGISNVDKLIPNPQFIKQIDNEEFELETAVISGKTLGGLKYSVKHPKAIPPVVVLPVWRFEPHQSSVMLTVKLSNEVLEKLPQGSSVSFNDLIVSVALKGATKSALSKPQGSFNKEKSRVTWKFPEPVTFSHTTTELKLIARFLTDEQGSEGDSGIALKFSVNDDNGASYIGTGLSLKSKDFDEEDPFKVEEWKDVETVRVVVSGTYSGSS